MDVTTYANAFIARWNGRKIDSQGVDINFDGRYGVQCMDLWNFYRFGLGCNMWLPTPNAKSVWHLPDDSSVWDYFTRIQANQPARLGDVFVYDWGPDGHIGVVAADLGNALRVLETNGLGDGWEDQYLNQYGSPARIHVWGKGELLGYLRPIGSTVTVQTDYIKPIEEDMPISQADANLIADTLLNAPVDRVGAQGGSISLRAFLAYDDAKTVATRQAIVDAAAATITGIMNTPIQRQGYPGGGEITLGAFLAWADTNTVALAEKVGAVASASQGFDKTLVERTIRDALKDQVKVTAQDVAQNLTITTKENQ